MRRKPDIHTDQKLLNKQPEIPVRSSRKLMQQTSGMELRREVARYECTYHPGKT